jgi:L-asparaginase
MKLTIITTGGTIDKIYFDAKSHYQIGDPQITEILATFGPALEFETISLMRKDSLEMTDVDRSLIRDTIMNSSNRRFVVTHGTDTMVDTARALAPLDDRVVVLTGALNPARFLGSDAVFNIGCAIAAAQCQPAGAWIAMNGRIWSPEEVRKNRDANRFEALNP